MASVRESVSFWAPRLRDVFRSARARIPYGQRQSDRYVKGLTARISDERCKCIEQVAALVIDVAQRGALTDAESIGDAFHAIARSEHERTHGAQIIGLIDAWQAETAAEGEKNRREILAVLEPSETNQIAFEDAKRAHEIADRRLSDALRREVLRRLALNPLVT